MCVCAIQYVTLQNTYMCVWAWLKLFVSFLKVEINLPGTFRNNHKSFHCNRIKCPSTYPFCLSISSLLYTISGSPSRLLCCPSLLRDLHLAVPLSINTEIWKFSLQFFRPLFTPPEAKKEKRKKKKVPSRDLSPNYKSESGGEGRGGELGGGVQNHKQTKQRRK